MKTAAIWVCFLCISIPAAASGTDSPPGLTASQIVEKNIAARGGLEAWRKVQSMTWVGHIESANAPAPNLPFVLEMKRPNKTRFEIKVPGQTSVRVYDGTHGWKLHQASHGKPEVQPYTQDELSFARDGEGVDGPLMDYQAKGISISLDGVEEVEGRRAYRLSIKLPSGNSHHVWIDAQTFLEIKYDRLARGKFGQSGMVSVYYRNYRTIEGLQMPLMIESRADRTKATDKMVIDRIILNPSLADKVFAYPGVTGRDRTATAGAGQPYRSPGFAGLAGPGQGAAGMRFRSSRDSVREQQ
jgi:hypothetical protein